MAWQQLGRWHGKHIQHTEPKISRGTVPSLIVCVHLYDMLKVYICTSTSVCSPTYSWIISQFLKTQNDSMFDSAILTQADWQNMTDSLPGKRGKEEEEMLGTELLVQWLGHWLLITDVRVCVCVCVCMFCVSCIQVLLWSMQCTWNIMAHLLWPNDLEGDGCVKGEKNREEV